MGPREDNPISVSVIVPVYNADSYLDQCLRSLICQTLKEIEIIIVNDGSTDASLRIINEYAMKYPWIMVVHQENKGLSVARNTGIKIASGEYIGFVDSDDWVTADMFERSYQRGKLDDADIVIANAGVYFEKEERLCEFWDRKLWDVFPDDIKNRAIDPMEYSQVFLLEPAAWRRLYRRSFLEKYDLRFLEGKIFEDMPFHFQTLLLTNRISLLDQCLYYYRIGNQGKITQRTDKSLFQVFDVMDNILTILKAADAAPEVWSKYVRFQGRVMLWLYDQIDAKYKGEFFRSIAKSIRKVDKRYYRQFQREFCSDPFLLSMYFCFRHNLYCCFTGQHSFLRILAFYYAVKHRQYIKIRESAIACINRYVFDPLRRLASRR